MQPSITCKLELLQQSLGDQLSEVQEEQLAQHLSQCESCRKKLEELAAHPSNWMSIGQALRDESSNDSSLSGERPRYADTKNYNADRQHNEARKLSLDDDEDGIESNRIKLSDFIVDYLQPADTPDAIGTLGNVEIRQFIGQGAHGVVLKGYQAELNRLVAVKVMAPHLASVIAARKRFSREARAAAAIVHPNVVPILQVDSTGQLPFLVMPYLDCQSLQERLDGTGPFAMEDCLRIGLQIARGLAAAHAQGLVHRDVKPANILIERGVDRVMLTDFGLARAVDDASLTRSGLIAGTPHFMSPEQARGDSLDARSDLFSLGSVLYAMITGRPPFRAETTYGILRRVTDDQPRPIHELTPTVAPWFEALIGKLLAKDPADRFRSADEVAHLLEECLTHHLHPGQHALPEAVQDLLPKPFVNATRLLTFVVVTTLCIVVATMFWKRDPINTGASDAKAGQSVNPSDDPAMSNDSTKGESASALEPTQQIKSSEDIALASDDDLESQLQSLADEIDKLSTEIEQE